jgi:LysR family tcuABC transcriptional regulator
VQAAQQARLSGHVSLGLSPSIAMVLGVPLLQAMRERYPDVRLHLVESLSGHLAAMLDARQLDLAVLFRIEASRRWSVVPLLDERLFLIGRHDLPGMPPGPRARLADLAALPLLMPSGTHGLRALVDAAFARGRREPRIAAEIDGLALLMDAVRAGVGATLQPGATVAREAGGELRCVPLADRDARRRSLLASVSDDELSPAGLAARVVVADVARRLVREGHWPGATAAEG